MIFSENRFPLFRINALEKARAQIDTVSLHQQENEKAGRAEERELPENPDAVDGDDSARKRPCDSNHLRLHASAPA